MKEPEQRKPELLAPAGDRDCIRAAIENGADAVYFGLASGFNARARAKNFFPEELPEIMAELHGRGVAGYVTLNTLVFPSELPVVEEHVRHLAQSGVDAVLVQDLGLVRLIREICPNLSIHASTQMTHTSSQTIATVQALGVERVVLARELSIDEIRRIRRETSMPLEVFVHGALCVAYSGQCLTSESLGGRSANRGQCAQACRLPYDLICDGKDVDLGEQKYLLSPQDLAAYDLVPQLIDAGVCSFKIEGRLKTPEYVANITRHYRQAIDAAWAKRPVRFGPREIEEMELSFSRGFSHGWLEGCDHKALVPALSSSKRGVLIGVVRAVRNDRVIIERRGSTADTPGIKRGDGVAFDCGRPVDDEQGGRIYEIFASGKPIDEVPRSAAGHTAPAVIELKFAHGAIDFGQLQPGMRVFKTDDPELTSRLRKSYSGAKPQRRMAIDIAVRASIASPLTIVVTTESGSSLTLATGQPCAEAIKHPLTEDLLREQFGRLGGTAYLLRSLTGAIEGRPMLPLSVLGALRHEMVRKLDDLLKAPKQRRIAPEPVLPQLRRTLARSASEGNGPSIAPDVTLHVLSRSLNQLREVLSFGITDVYADFQDIREYREAVAICRERSARIVLATPRIQKPDEMGIFRALAKHEADGILVRNLSGVQFYAGRGIPVVADFSLNAANELTAQYLIEQGARRVTASYDLNHEQLLDLVHAVPPEWLEVVIHQHMPMFHMEHCVFCAVLSPGTNKTNCGRPCDTHEVKLRDRIGMEHRLVADVGCRNTLFNAVPQSGAELVPPLLDSGMRHYRVELLDDHGPPLRRVLELYQRLLSGGISGKEVWTQLRATNRVGVTRGTLEERRNPLAII